MTTPHPVPSAEGARFRLIYSALQVLAAEYTDPQAWDGAKADYADDELALAARDLTTATDALPTERQPYGWHPTVTGAAT